ncbi:MAG: DUF167 domain-containing protein [Desulfuromonadales bacterium]|nr:DUF167 domain-containing protein [Desulfuromonadales bacterium]MDT8424307.1 DUF167 domain-containing protein [Desulfuromonadales bacterium]
MDFLTVSVDGVILALHVQPRASKNEIIGVFGGEIRVRLTSPPVDGAANKLCREFIAKQMGVAKSSVEVVAGDKSRHKRVLVRGLSLAEVAARLANDCG